MTSQLEMTSSQFAAPDPDGSWLAVTANLAAEATPVVVDDFAVGPSSTPALECGRAVPDEACLTSRAAVETSAVERSAVEASAVDAQAVADTEAVESVSPEETAMMAAIVRPRFVAMSFGLVSIGIFIGHVIGVLMI